jgi:sulfite exporter TauE/SafE
MRPHPFDAVSAALGLIVAGIGAFVAFGGTDSFDSGWLLALGALVLGLGLVPWTRGRRRDHDDLIS